MAASPREKNVALDTQKKNKRREEAHMDARDRFHLARARAHLAAGDSSRAARHLNKCAFGMRTFPPPRPDAPKATNLTDIRYVGFSSNPDDRNYEEKIPLAERQAILAQSRLALERQRDEYDKKRSFFERTTGAPRFGEERAAYSTACAAADAFRKIPEAELEARKNAGDGVDAKPWETFRREIIEARHKGDFNKVFDLAVRQKGFWNANDLGAGFTDRGIGRESIAKLIGSSG